YNGRTTLYPVRGAMSDRSFDQPILFSDDSLPDSSRVDRVPVPAAVPYGSGLPQPMALMPDAERAFWVAWNRVRGVGPARFGRLIELFGDATTAWRAPVHDLRATGFDERLIADIERQRQAIDPDAEMARLERLQIAAITLHDPEYPRLLREIPLPPAVLYVRGELLPADERAIAIVGTRRVSAYGRQTTQQLARELAEQGMTIVSGLARGIDGIAHTAALDAGGRTLAVLGCGPDMVYPPEHANLAARIVAQGAVISEFAAGMRPEAGNFPARNRIISGMSSAVLVTEAPEKSGALITTRFAADQGRDVMAVPGSIFSRTSVACNRLIQDGALCVTSVADIINALNIHLLPQQMDMRALLPADATEARLLELLADEPRYVDDLCRDADLSAAVVSSTLIMLELKGLVRNLGNMTYGRA
ncbi:MAG TPA: DNA-processing protein DprA, partial [Ktedonobacterales bacterium]|nr:DNA-processing protein DprA [Ktedonobacterales bacterium]